MAKRFGVKRVSFAPTVPRSSEMVVGLSAAYTFPSKVNCRRSEPVRTVPGGTGASYPRPRLAGVQEHGT